MASPLNFLPTLGNLEKTEVIVGISITATDWLVAVFTSYQSTPIMAARLCSQSGLWGQAAHSHTQHT